MIIYKDIFTQDELFSDTYPMELLFDCLYKVQGKHITISGDVDDSLIGGNASAEGGDEGVEANSISGVNVVLANRLVKTEMDKKGYRVHIKEYMKRVKDHLEKQESTETETFLKNASEAVKSILGEFKEYDFYIGESMNADGMVVLLKWDEETPYVYYFKHGLDAEKV